MSLLTSVAHAQKRTPDLRPGNFEAGFYGGASHGVDAFHYMAGANLSYSLPKLLLPYVEFSYFPEIQRKEVAKDNSFTFFGQARIIDFHAGVHVRLIPKETRIVPYGVAGFGVLASRITGCNQLNTVSTFTGCSASNPSQSLQEPVTSNDPAVNVGAGLRVYHTSAFGYRSEFKIYRPLSGRFTNWVPKIEGGIFFQFGAH